jgi:hypothetical protein
VNDLGVLNDPTQELSRAVALAVVESSCDVEIRLSFRDVMFASRHDSMVRLVVE